MHTLTAELIAAHQNPTAVPYVRLVFTKRSDGSTLDLTARWLRIEHELTQYGGVAVISFENHDLSITNLKGYYVDIGYGYVTTTGNEYQNTPRLDVIAQTIGNSPDAPYGVTFEVALAGNWERLAKVLATLGTAPYFYKLYNKTDTPYDIAEDIIEGEAGMTLKPLVLDDGIMDTFLPYFEVNRQPHENCRDLLYRVAVITMSYIRNLPANEFDVVFPQITDAVNKVYYDNQNPIYYSYKERQAQLIPNKIICYCNLNVLAATEAELWASMITGTAADADSITEYGEVIGYAVSKYIDNQPDADNRALALLTKVKAETVAGVGVTRLDPAIQLYDYLQFEQTRGYI